MRRAPLVIAGTIAGTVAVLAFPVESSHLDVSGSTPSVTSGTGASPGATTPASSPTGTSGPSTTPSAPTSTTEPTTTTSGTNSATGAEEQYRYGQLAVTVTVEGGKISKATIASISETDPRSASIDNYAVPQLEQQAIEADSANIDGVSGATYTSEAFVGSLTSALDKLGFK